MSDDAAAATGPAPSEIWIEKKDAVERLKIPERTIQRWAAEGRIEKNTETRGRLQVVSYKLEDLVRMKESGGGSKQPPTEVASIAVRPANMGAVMPAPKPAPVAPVATTWVTSAEASRISGLPEALLIELAGAGNELVKAMSWRAPAESRGKRRPVLWFFRRDSL